MNMKNPSERLPGMRGEKMGQVLREYPSKSSPGKVYEIIRGGDGKTYCTCWQWKLNRTCSHLEDYLMNCAKGYTVRTAVVNGKKETYLDMQEAIDKAVRELL